ncbi:DNA mismatch repair endonuclease MutL [uncultured Methanoregula sp.]|uniref:DNA mismatch repair endonuclease MutL n=1 Tax=uncultured Methanoregula sp. TaxID=1005933 RepID=UPI002AABDBA8|nr:DNA mismatch repair endonuclease MutL [uncultured Methanoregula sp.]
MDPKNPAPVIRVLDTATVNKIAAGEVVDRPASVMKELIENAIDAGARTIRIGITSSDGGITTIRVTDDGWGMLPSDALLAFTQHATSKIVTIDDLNHIATLGFRGEALASIAAVSRVTLLTKPKGSGTAAGTKIVVYGGKVLEQQETGTPEGTTILVEELFFNTPARKKFLKSLNTELAHIHTVLEGICLAWPQISFRFFYNEREQLVTDRSEHALDTIARIYGSELARMLIQVSHSEPFVKISGYIAPPSLARKDTSRLIVAINRRYVSSPLISNAVKEGYGTLLPRDRIPVAFLTLAIDTALVDVNVHPTKKEVRLSRENEIRETVRNAVNTALLSRDLIPAAAAPEQLMECLIPAMEEPVIHEYQGGETLPDGVFESTHIGTLSSDQHLRQTELPTGSPGTLPKIPAMEVIGEFGGIYILARTSTDELVIIDQHAAHERILYEQVARQDPGHQSQELIAPVILHRTPRDTAVIRDLLPALAREGFVLEDFGRDTFLVRAIPVVLGRTEGTGIIDEIISDLVSPDSARSVTNRERLTRIIACRGAIKAGTVLTREQCQRVIDQLRLTTSPFTCPHGRPTIIRFTREDLDAMFKRI